MANNINQGAESTIIKSNNNDWLDFEKTLAELSNQIVELQNLQKAKGIDYSPEIRQLRNNLVKLTTKIYDNLSAWETVQVARHPKRPLLQDYLKIIVQDFRELHGDRCFGDDRAMVTGIGRIGREKVLIVGHNKGRSTEEKVACHFGCAHPEGYRKALLKMKLAEKFQLPIICLIDTPGAYPGIGAEERGQAQAIANNLMEMSLLRTPIVCVVIGEGGSGGALGIGVGDRLAIMQNAYYSVITPEGCAAILWKTGEQAAQAAEALKLTAKHLLKFNVADQIIPEPLGGAHRNHHDAAHNLEMYLVNTLRDLRRCKMDNLLENRYRKLRRIGQYSNNGSNKAASAKTRISGLAGNLSESAPETPVRKKPIAH
ncbi:MAG: acetyl-CoA carboxylase carboxyltransferase subunit alpha [Sedimentisphaerales bacterium]|nr:acetyl-CoA carboxylase carboxyltransferase subunit alpha [Sedimentisphaerales bacterium]